MSTIQDPHTAALIEAAGPLGLNVKDLSEAWGADVIEVSLGDHRELIMDGRVYSHLSYLSATFADDKGVSKALLTGSGLKVPAHHLLDIDLDESIEAQLEGKMNGETNYVCKPLYGTDGHAVGMNKRDAMDVDMHIEPYTDNYQHWMVEEQVEGKDIRIQVIGGQIAAACVREPASVIGDGFSDVEGLIEKHNEKIQALNPNNKLELDADSRRLMREQSLYLDTVVEAGRKIQLKYISNMGQGGVASDITPDLHSEYHELVTKVSNAFGFRTFALDGISADPGLSPFEHLYALEVNAKAQWLHHTFSEVRTHDIPTMILRDLFPELNR